IKFLMEEMCQRGYKVVETEEPSSNRVGTFLKRYQRRDEKRLPAEAEVLLYAADRFDHLKTVIEPALRRGDIVISNRYFYSSLAYQGSVDVDLDWIREMNAFALKPDLAVLLDILPEYSLQRLKRRRTVFERVENLRRVRDIYIQLVKTGELVSVDADRSKKAVQEELLGLVEGLLESKDSRI
ncbi:dTMP kinase, partial [Patescibacteria group bacterium]|nr:dTMP kinase [Patescibacteria group bacterium]